MQSVSGGFTAAAGAGAQKIADYVEIAWSGIGAITDARGAIGWTDETPYLVQHSGELRRNAPGVDLIQPGSIGSATVVLWNHDGRFAWELPTGYLYAFIGSAVGLTGKLIRIWVGYEVSGVYEYVCIFTGVITEWQPNDVLYQVTLSCRDIGYLYLQNKLNSTVSQDQYPSAWITAVAATAGISLANIDPGLFRIPYTWLDGDSSVEEIWETARADNGVAYFNQRGYLCFENILHLLTHTLAWTFDEDDYVRPEPAHSMDDVATEIVTEWAPRYVAPPDAVYTMDHARIIAPGATEVWDAKYNYPVVTRCELLNTDHDRDYWAVATSGMDMTDWLTITFSDEYAMKATVSVTNTHTTIAAHLVFFQIRAYALNGEPNEEEKQAVTPPPYPFTRSRSNRQNVYVQTQRQAKAYNGYLAEKHSRVRAIQTLRGVPIVPQLELGDLVAYYEAQALGALVAKQGYVVGINWLPVEGVGLAQDVQVLDMTGLYPDTNVFIIGVDTLGHHKVCWF